MPWSALPEWLDSPEKWAGSDHDTKWTRWILRLKGAMAFGPRATERWARWRQYPRTLLALRSKQGVFRIEAEGWERETAYDCVDTSDYYFLKDLVATKNYPNFVAIEPGYLSRVQKYTRWSLQIQWPFFVAFHWYRRASDVPVYGDPVPSGFADGKVVFAYFGAQRNGDKFYMFPAAYVGFNWK